MLPHETIREYNNRKKKEILEEISLFFDLLSEKKKYPDVEIDEYRKYTFERWSKFLKEIDIK